MTDDSSATGTPAGATAATPPPRRNPWLVLGVIVVLAAVVAGGVWFQSSRGDDDTASGTPDTSDLVAEPLEEGLALGEAEGPIVDIYLDYQCSHCADLEAVIGTEVARLAAEEEALVVLRPVNFLSRASGRGAAALYCAADTGQAYALHQEMLSDLSADFSPEGLTATAAAMGVDETEFGACMEDRETRSWVSGVTARARTDGVAGTPAVFVDGTRLTDAQLNSGPEFRAAVLAGDA